MNAIKILIEEHDSILEMINILQHVCTKLDDGNDIDPDILSKMVKFIKVYADGTHHGKEEDLLFVEMEKAGIHKQGGPIGVMLSEHVIGRNFVKGMEEAISAIKSGEEKSKVAFVENAMGYINLLTDHINKENNVLFVMAEQALSKEKIKDLTNKFEEFDKSKKSKINEELIVLDELKKKFF
ncbi:MAG: hemerythrin domain-containing protein [Candidatus Hodarchaeales archaeon]|jgi:hemerythrin-like domain-containing protein